VDRIAAETGNTAVEDMELDLGSLAAVRQSAKEVEARGLRLRSLVCNAGIQTTKQMQSPDGHELTFAVNHLGHFLLTNLLLENLLANAPARILIVASGVHDPRLKTGMPKAAVGSFDVLAQTGCASQDYNGRLAYVNSKLCNLWFAYELIRRLEAAGLGGEGRPLSVNAFEPGLVPGSGLARDYHPVARFVWNNVLPVLTYFMTTVNTAERSGSALAEKTLDPSLERVSGKYFPSHTRFGEGASSDDSYDTARARELWELSVRLTDLSPEDSPLAG
jgi:NAD(P)-dependent dehydrogenase (short-subunit alcohol dehydrogenase family)